MQKTKVIKKADLQHSWYLIDASKYPLGKVSVMIAELLIGKKKLTYTTNMFSGDNVVVVNAAKAHVSPKKTSTKMYYKHSGFPGGLVEKTFEQLLKKSPRAVIMHAVKGMVPKTKMGDEMLRHIHIYNDAQHEHEAQQPINL